MVVSPCKECESAFNIVELLKTCATQRDLAKGSKLHAYVREHNLLENNSHLASSLVDMYAKCGALVRAQQVLNELSVRDVITWSALIAGYAQHGQGEDALKCYDKMQFEGHFPDAITFTCALKACSSIRTTAKGEEIHQKIISLGMLEKDIVLGNSLVDMYAKCGSPSKAQQVLDELPMRDAISWNVLIAGYVQHGQGERALNCYDCMQREGHRPDAVTFIFALKACGNVRAAARGKEINDRIVSLGMLENDAMLKNALVDMYVKCGALMKAEQVLEEHPDRNVVTWTTLIAGYTHHGQEEEALKCFDRMQHEGHAPNVVTFICGLKACGSIGAAAKGKQIHDQIVRLGILKASTILGTALVDMYAKCGALVKAKEVLKELPIWNVATWNALASGFARQGEGEEVLECFEDMQCEGHYPNAITFNCALKACGSIGALDKGKQIHSKIISLGMLEKNTVLGNALMDMYARCGALVKAQKLLQEHHIRNVVSWTVLISRYAQQHQGEEALNCFAAMQHEGHSPNTVTLIYVLKACGSIGAIEKGQEIHVKIFHLGLLEKFIMLGSAVVEMYAKCGALTKAERVLEELPIRDVVMWNALIAGYAQQGQGQKALKWYDIMQCEGHSPDVVALTCALRACGTIGAAAKSEQIHDRIVNSSMFEKDIVFKNTLVDVYAKCGALAKAQQVFEELPVQDAVRRDTLIAGYLQQGQGLEALLFFDSMQLVGHFPTVGAFTCALKACGSVGASMKGEWIHDMLVSLGMLKNDIVLGRAMVNMYAKCGALGKAQQVLDEFCAQDVVTWNALVAGYMQHGQGEEALKCYDSMQRECHFPDAITFNCALKACGSIAALAKGEEIHDRIVSMGMLEKDIALGSTLVDMYARCGALAKALELFKELPIQNLVTWNALLGGYAQHGQSMEALHCFEDMHIKGMKADSTTLVCMLNACSHSGLVDQAEMIFLSVNSKYGILLVLEHYCCMVDLFGRVGKFHKALDVLEKMPFVEYFPIWVSLLGACRKWGEVKVGRMAFEHAHHLDKFNHAVYVCMVNMYTAADMIEVIKEANKDYTA